MRIGRKVIGKNSKHPGPPGENGSGRCEKKKNRIHGGRKGIIHPAVELKK